MGFPCVQTVVVWVFLAFKPWWYGFSLRPKCGGRELINKNDLSYRRDWDSLDFLYRRASQTCPRAVGSRAGLAGPRVKKIQAVPFSSIRYIPFRYCPEHTGTAQSIPVSKTNWYCPEHTGTAQNIPVLSRAYRYCPGVSSSRLISLWYFPTILLLDNEEFRQDGIDDLLKSSGALSSKYGKNE